MHIPSKKRTSSPSSEQPHAKRFVSEMSRISETVTDLDNNDFDLAVPNLSRDTSDSSDNETIGVNENYGQDELWTKVNSRNDFVPKNIPFTGIEGVKVRVKGDPGPMDFFNLYITQKIIELLVVETNRYAKQYIALKGDTLKEHSNVRNWKETDEHEMRAFLGVLLLMGIIVMKFLHFSNNDDPSFDPKDENRDRLHKIRPLINMIRQRCTKVYYPGKNLSVDESLVLFKGRLAFKQYIKTKCARFGIKLYELCSSNGEVKMMRNTRTGEDDEEHKDFSVTEKLPAKLMTGYYGNGHCVFVDNFYTSPKLAEYMVDNNTHLCGTVNRKRCNYSKEIALEELEKGKAVFYKSGQLLACKY
jgi:hypothetical protein